VLHWIKQATMKTLSAIVAKVGWTKTRKAVA
jgi:hypothetical protein